MKQYKSVDEMQVVVRFTCTCSCGEKVERKVPAIGLIVYLGLLYNVTEGCVKMLPTM